MASSLAAMPHETAPWKDPSRPTPTRGFFNILIPPPQPSSSPADPAAAVSASAPTPRRRRRQILERWAAAAAAITASAAPAPADQRRRARDAELSALASATRPIAARAAVFREPSPAPSDASSTTAAAPELPPAGPRASSLIQRWREIEAVGPATPRATCGGDLAASDSDGGSPRGRVGCIVKKLSGTSSLPEDELDDAAAKAELPLSQSAPPSPAPVRDAAQRPAAINGPRSPQLVVRTVRGRRAMEELVAKMAHRRRREVAALAERHAVSRFANKGRIQSMLRLRLLHQGGTVEDDVWTLLRPVRPHQPKHVQEDNTLRNDSRDTDLGEANNYSQRNNGKCGADEHSDDRVPAEEKSIGICVESLVNSDGLGNIQCDELLKTNGNQCQKDSANFCIHSQKYSEASSFARYGEHGTVDDNQFGEDISPSTTSTLCDLQTPSRGDNLREDNQSLNGSWEERGLWISGLGWPAPIDSMSPDSWHQDAMEDIENHNQIQFNDRPWIDSPNSWRSLCVATQSDCRAVSHNADICNLLESKNVSKSLESDFGSKMNQLLLSVLHKQRQQRIMDDFGGYYDEHMYWRQNDQIQNADHVVSAPCSLAPVSHLAAHQQESWQHSSFESQHHENQHFLEMEVRVRSEMSQIHHEIYELRKLVESCIASQVKVQHSIKKEVCSALREAGLMPNQPDTTAKRGSCCMCYSHVDSLLYRCGHMCTCFDCADQLKSSSRGCPICQSPIEDVVRARPNF